MERSISLRLWIEFLNSLFGDVGNCSYNALEVIEDITGLDTENFDAFGFHPLVALGVVDELVALMI